MIIRTKAKKTKDSGVAEQTISENKPGVKFRKKVTEVYQTKVKPAASKSIQEAAQDLKEMITRQ